MRVCLLPCDFDGSGSYRCLFPLRELTKVGFEWDMPPWERQDKAGHETIQFDIGKVPDADLYVFQRRLEHEALLVAAELQAAGKVVVSETDDWFMGIPGYNGAVYGTQKYKRSFAVHDGNLLVKREVKEGSRENMHRLFSMSDALTVTTPFLADQYSRFNRNVHVLPNFLDWEMWENVQPQYEVERDRIRIGYMGGSEWHAGDLRLLQGLIGPFMRRHPEVDFVVSGNDNENIHDLLEIPEDQRITYGRARFEDLPIITAVMDIGLVPLVSNGFNEAKSCLKGMEYAACGVPCIATPTESYRGWVEDGSNGFLADKPRKWISRLETLVSDDALRRAMGRRARDKARRHTIQAEAHRWASLYQSLV